MPKATTKELRRMEDRAMSLALADGPGSTAPGRSQPGGAGGEAAWVFVNGANRFEA